MNAPMPVLAGYARAAVTYSLDRARTEDADVDVEVATSRLVGGNSLEAWAAARLVAWRTGRPAPDPSRPVSRILATADVSARRPIDSTSLHLLAAAAAAGIDGAACALPAQHTDPALLHELVTVGDYGWQMEEPAARNPFTRTGTLDVIRGQSEYLDNLVQTELDDRALHAAGAPAPVFAHHLALARNTYAYVTAGRPEDDLVAAATVNTPEVWAAQRVHCWNTGNPVPAMGDWILLEDTVVELDERCDRSCGILRNDFLTLVLCVQAQASGALRLLAEVCADAGLLDELAGCRFGEDVDNILVANPRVGVGTLEAIAAAGGPHASRACTVLAERGAAS